MPKQQNVKREIMNKIISYYAIDFIVIKLSEYASASDLGTIYAVVLYEALFSILVESK